jgi:hypothetical protein
MIEKAQVLQPCSDQLYVTDDQPRRRKMRQKIETKKLKNKTMDDATFALRTKVMGFIYEAKEIVDLPRIEIRITESHKSIMGLARVSGCVIWIPEDTLNERDNDIRQIVFHEILHAVFGTPHIDSCPLMCPVHKSIKTREEVEKLFKSHATKGAKS